LWRGFKFNEKKKKKLKIYVQTFPIVFQYCVEGGAEENVLSAALSSVDAAFAEIIKGAFLVQRSTNIIALSINIRIIGDNEQESWQTPGVRYNADGSLTNR